MHLARREEGALTSALHRCLARRTPTLKLELDPVSRGFFELGSGVGVTVVSRGTIASNAVARTTQPSLMSMHAWSMKWTGSATDMAMCGEVVILASQRDGTETDCKLKKSEPKKSEPKEGELKGRRAKRKAS